GAHFGQAYRAPCPIQGYLGKASQRPLAPVHGDDAMPTVARALLRLDHAARTEVLEGAADGGVALADVAAELGLRAGLLQLGEGLGYLELRLPVCGGGAVCDLDVPAGRQLHGERGRRLIEAPHGLEHAARLVPASASTREAEDDVHG